MRQTGKEFNAKTRTSEESDESRLKLKTFPAKRPAQPPMRQRRAE
jgi:hypothetical protein